MNLYLQVLVGSNGVYSLVQVGGCVTTNINPLVQLGTTNINQMTTSTSTVTCNTGLKVSVPPSSEYQPKVG